MTPPNRPARPNDPRDAAAWWFARACSGNFTAAGQQSLDQWRAADPRHEQEWQTLAFLWQTSADLPRAELRLMLAEAEAEAETETETETESRVASKAPAPSRVPPRGQARPMPRARQFGWGLATALTLIVLGLGLYLNQPGYVAELVTARGEIRQEALPDGSVLTLNTDSRATVRYYPGRRSVELGAGEAHFEVAHRDRQAFFVTAGSASVRVTGTVFSVRRLDDGARITVQAGAVELRQGAWWQVWREPTRLGANQAADLTRGRLSAISTVNADRLTAWREGKLAFSNQSLAQVVDEMNRYLAQPIRIDDPGLRDRRVSGIFNLADPEDFGKAVQASLPVKLRVRPDGGLDLLPR